MFGKQEIYQFLEQQSIVYEKCEHSAVYNMEELVELQLPHGEWEGKNLFIKESKKKNYFLLTVRGEKQVDLKAFRKKIGVGSLTFASPEELQNFLGLEAGSVTPLGILNDTGKKVRFFLDQEFEGNMIGIHPNDNTATVWMESEDLMRVISSHGNECEYFKFEEKTI